ncbi:MAG: hypothetical protein IPI24_02590 [Ignavibacteria bacterium]|nr:hypothetical protein [Ignavibacteria bacterium]MBK6760483.1 hypothetical protein [Ignavibacteria bacterium]MBK7411734.1 hypothetical protein [Ignavibacteria bacterium]MBK7576303.1 hypothetical protein [Ignavibacteria bacterium]MBK9182251.1 hypothetical protein [Ignavibacteria bacterium]
MKNTLVVMVLLMTIGCQAATSQHDDLTETFDKYIRATKSDSPAEQLEYLHPRVFDFISKDTLLLGLELIKQSTMIKAGNEKIVSKSDVITHDGVQYALLTYSQQLSMDVSDMKGQGGANVAISLMLNELKSQYGADNVVFNEKLFTVEMTTTNYVYAILDSKYREWKYLPKTKELAHVTEQVVPDTIRQRF